MVVNPAAGGGKGRRRAPAILARLEAALGTLEVHETERAGHATELARAAVRTGAARVIAVGGDGTVHEVLQGLLGETAPGDRRRLAAGSRRSPGTSAGGRPATALGVVPVGTGNSFLRDFGVDSSEEALRRIAFGKRRPVDVGRFEARGASGWFLNLLGAGFIADVAETTNRVFKPLGPSGYVAGVLAKLAALPRPETTIVVDGRTVFDGKLAMAAVCNSQYTGGRMWMAPNASADDGQLDIIAAGDLGRMELLRVFPSLFLGTHVSHPKVRIYRGTRVRIESVVERHLMPDGEVRGTTPVEVRMLPKAIDVLV